MLNNNVKNKHGFDSVTFCGGGKSTTVKLGRTYRSVDELLTELRSTPTLKALEEDIQRIEESMRKR